MKYSCGFKGYRLIPVGGSDINGCLICTIFLVVNCCYYVVDRIRIDIIIDQNYTKHTSLIYHKFITKITIKRDLDKYLVQDFDNQLLRLLEI